MKHQLTQLKSWILAKLSVLCGGEITGGNVALAVAGAFAASCIPVGVWLILYSQHKWVF